MKITAIDTCVSFSTNDVDERIYHAVTESSTRRLQRVIYRMQVSNPDKIRIEPMITTTFGWEAFIEY